MTTTSDEIRQRIAYGLWNAREDREPIKPVRDDLGVGDVAAAYQVQEILTLRRIKDGSRVVGRKIGLTSPAVQQQLGVDQPDFGVLFTDMARAEDDPIDTTTLIAPKIEAEVAFVLAADLADGDLDAARVRDSIDYAVPALEIVDSRILDWDISIVDTVADNASSALFVLGAARHPVHDLDLAGVTMTLTADGRTVSHGTGRACLGDPLNAVVWLAETCRSLGLPLRAGEVVLSGALGPMTPVEADTTYRAELSELGSVAVPFV